MSKWTCYSNLYHSFNQYDALFVNMAVIIYFEVDNFTQHNFTKILNLEQLCMYFSLFLSCSALEFVLIRSVLRLPTVFEKVIPQRITYIQYPSFIPFTIQEYPLQSKFCK